MRTWILTPGDVRHDPGDDAYTRTKELTVDAALPSKGIAGVRVTMHQAGPGHYVADAFQLVPGGDRRLTVTDRVSDFDEYSARLTVPVR